MAIYSFRRVKVNKITGLKSLRLRYYSVYELGKKMGQNALYKLFPPVLQLSQRLGVSG
jgi:hypothetical protein